MNDIVIAVIGAGFSGTLLALHALHRCSPSTRIVLIERNPQFGRGQAYSTGNPHHLLNVPAGKMSAFRDRPLDFLDWLRAEQPAELGGTPPDENSFVSRRVFGAYVRHLLNQEMKRPGVGERLDLVRGDVCGLDASGERLRLHLNRERLLEADFSVLAIGNFPPEPPPVADPSFYDSVFYRSDPWAADTLTELDLDAPVLLIGTGLTMVDTVISLLDQGHRGQIHALSRRGLLPRKHAAAGAFPESARGFPTSLTSLVRLLRREIARAKAAGGNWRPVIDQLRPFTCDVWQSMSAEDRARFLRHLRPWWDVHRHRMPGEVGGRIEASRAAGQLHIHAGQILTFEEREGASEVRFRRRFSDEVIALRVARVVNCSGPGCDYARISHPLIRALLRDGIVRPDPLHLGLDVPGTCALLNRDGEISRRLFAIGPVTKGAFWEMTAVPDIRGQCEVVADHLAKLVQSKMVLAGAIRGGGSAAERRIAG